MKSLNIIEINHPNEMVMDTLKEGMDMVIIIIMAEDIQIINMDNHIIIITIMVITTIRTIKEHQIITMEGIPSNNE